MHIYLSLYNIYLRVDPKRKILITGSVPTENLPTKSHEVPKAERRILVRPDIQPSTSQEQPTSFEHTSAAGVSSIEELMADLNNMPMWKVEEMQDKEVSIKLFEEPYSIPKYTVLVDSGLEFNAVNRAARRKSKALAEPAKSKASLAACGPEKLRATVQATRLECKQLQDRLKHLQTKIEKDGVGISASLETDLLKIMGARI